MAIEKQRRSARSTAGKKNVWSGEENEKMKAKLKGPSTKRIVKASQRTKQTRKKTSEKVSRTRKRTPVKKTTPIKRASASSRTSRISTSSVPSPRTSTRRNISSPEGHLRLPRAAKTQAKRDITRALTPQRSATRHNNDESMSHSSANIRNAVSEQDAWCSIL